MMVATWRQLILRYLSCVSWGMTYPVLNTKPFSTLSVVFSNQMAGQYVETVHSYMKCIVRMLTVDSNNVDIDPFNYITSTGEDSENWSLYQQLLSSAVGSRKGLEVHLLCRWSTFLIANIVLFAAIWILGLLVLATSIWTRSASYKLADVRDPHSDIFMRLLCVHACYASDNSFI